jgi:hypothetical protein
MQGGVGPCGEAEASGRHRSPRASYNDSKEERSCDLPIFKAANVTIHGFARKGGNLRLVEAGWEGAKLMQPVRCCAAGRKLGSGLEGGPARSARK